MNRIAVFFHARLSGGISQSQQSVHADWGRSLFIEQMNLLESSGLYENSNEIFIGLNGDGADRDFVDKNAPLGCKILCHGVEAKSLLPTFRFIRDWLPGHEDWLVSFWHMKGATHFGNAAMNYWRRRMEIHVIEHWRTCVADLEAGYDTVGAHWLTREQFGPVVNPEHGGTPFWGGVFWWATAKYLMTLPPLIQEVRHDSDWFYPEHWIGMGPRLPKVKDYQPGWP